MISILIVMKNILCFSKLEYDIYNLHIKAITGDIDYNEILKQFKTFERNLSSFD